MTPEQKEALQSFASCLSFPADAEKSSESSPLVRILYAPAKGMPSVDETGTLSWFRTQGFEVEEVDPAKDLRFLSLKRENFDGIWCGQALVAFPIDEAQRVMATFFQALKPRTGVVFAAFLEGEGVEETPQGLKVYRYPEPAFAPMIRQNGFQILLSGRREKEGKWIGVIARRI